MRVEETPFRGALVAREPYMHAQLRWPEAIRLAHKQAVRLGTKWTMIADDDTFVLPHNVLRVLRGYDPASPSVLLGQACPAIGGLRRLCGGAGWVMSSPLHASLVRVLRNCTARGRRKEESLSDTFLSACMCVAVTRWSRDT